MVVPCAQLRVFVPRDSLHRRGELRWATAPAGPAVAVGLSEARTREERATRRMLLTGRGGVAESAVLVRRAGDEHYVCPLQFELRSAAALRELKRRLPQAAIVELFPDRSLRERLGRAGATGRRPTIVDGPWVVPVPWFLLFSPSERRFTHADEGRGPRLVHLTRASSAMERLARAIDAIDDTLPDAGDLLEELADLATWVESFPERSLVELDYGTLADVIGPALLQADHSCRDAWAVVEGLEEGDHLAAVAYYGALRGRWSGMRAKATAS